MINILECPYCQKKLSVNLNLVRKKGVLEYGSVFCSCDEYPVIESIYVLDKKKSKKSLYFLQKHDYKSAFLHALLPNNFLSKYLTNLTFLLHNLGISKLVNISFFTSLVLFLFKVLRGKNFTYHLERGREKDVSLFFLPLMVYRGITTKKLTWLNIGGGIFTYYKETSKAFPNISFIHLDCSFPYIVFSKRMFGSSNVLYVYHDVELGIPMKSKSVDIATFFDSLTFIKTKKRVLSELTSKMKVKQQSVVFVTALVEHFYLSLNQEMYPISTFEFKKYFPKEHFYLLSDHKMVDAIDDNFYTNQLEQIRIRKKNYFRYHAMWSNKKIKALFLNYKVKDLFIESKKKHAFSWLESKKTWSNNAY